MKLKSFSNKDRYGNMFSIEFFEPDTTIPMMMMIPDMPDGYNGADTSSHPGGPKGTDTVPAWLTPGENVVNAEASRLPGNQEKIDEMNEQGRTIQQAQGGPIPTYEADGGTVYAADGAQVYTKRMPNGRMGVWKGNTFLNYVQEENDGMLKSLRDKIGWGKDSSWSLFNSDGGQVPAVYAADGSWITEDVIKRLIQTESSGRPTVVNPKSGATGAAQIMEKTAIDPGYGVTPILPDERNDPVKSATFARQYLEGIQREHPEWTPEEVLQAYNAGPTRLAEYKAASPEDRVPLKPETIEYPGKILSAPKQEMSFWDRINPISSAQAATGVPDTTPPVPREENIGFWDFVTTPTGELKEKTGRTLWETLTTPTDELKYKGDPSKVDTSEDSKLFDLDQIQRAAQYPLEMFGVPVEPDAPGVPVPNIFTEGKDAYFKFNDELYVKDMKKNEEELRNTINERKANKQPISPELVEAHKKAVANVAKAEKQQADRISDKKKVTESEEKAVVEAQSYVPEEGKAPPKPADSKATTLNTLADDLLKNIPDNKKVPSDQGDNINAAGKKKLAEDPTFTESIVTGFKELFGEMFTPKEIARMVVTYAGSRALGYDHDASLGYSAKQLVTRYDSAITQRQKDVRDKDFMELYTKESLDKYLETGNRDDLIEKKTGTTVQGFGDLIEHDTLGTLQTVKVGKDKYAIEYNGQYYPFDSPLMKGQIQKHNPKYDNAQEVEDYFAKRAKDKISNINAAVDQDGKRIDTEGATQATELSNRYLSDVKTFAKGRPEAKAKLRAEALRAQDDYWNAVKKANATGGKQPNSVLSFYNKRAMVVNTEGAVSANDLKGADIAKVLELNDQVLNFAGNRTKNPDDAAKVYKGFWKRASKQWDAHSKGTKFIGMKPSDDSEHNDYTYWVSQLLNTEGEHHAEAMALLNKK